MIVSQTQKRSLSTPRSATHKRFDWRHQKGSALVEMTLVLPFLVMMAFGMVETGMGWRNAITVTSAARQGARVSSHLGQNVRADQEAILAIQAVLGQDIDQVEFIVIYNANGSGLVPTACLGGSQSGGAAPCNHYTPDMIANASNDALWGCTGTYDSSWCPTSRDDDSRSADHIGVFIRFQHEYFTGVVPGDAPMIERHTVMRVEPVVE